MIAMMGRRRLRGEPALLPMSLSVSGSVADDGDGRGDEVLMPGVEGADV